MTSKNLMCFFNGKWAIKSARVQLFLNEFVHIQWIDVS